jgi:hypothetical protein
MNPSSSLIGWDKAKELVELFLKTAPVALFFGLIPWIIYFTSEKIPPTDLSANNLILIIPVALHFSYTILVFVFSFSCLGALIAHLIGRRKKLDLNEYKFLKFYSENVFTLILMSVVILALLVLSWFINLDINYPYALTISLMYFSGITLAFSFLKDHKIALKLIPIIHILILFALSISTQVISNFVRQSMTWIGVRQVGISLLMPEMSYKKYRSLIDTPESVPKCENGQCIIKDVVLINYRIGAKCFVKYNSQKFSINEGDFEVIMLSPD